MAMVIYGIEIIDQIDVLYDHNNMLIKRVKDTGKIIHDKYVIIHNGIKVNKNNYYGIFNKYLTLNYGCL
jgi:hypothetical protein